MTTKRTAKEMFENLNLKITQNKNIIGYKNQESKYGRIAIVFDLNEKTFYISAQENIGGTNVARIDIALYGAIHQQIKELGWSNKNEWYA